ncbi:DUF6528 family protein [Phytomonospora sp. NPDC050363]|uniref:DUF6528 family protein n=1 Tax=Phytomonospora sp. NPDC050363 TaxID=3155642 RepID=UPI0033EE8BF5
MNRRSILRGLALGAAAAPAAVLLGGEAQAAQYSVVATEQTANKIYVWPKGKSLSVANRLWSWDPGSTSGWSNLSDVKLRKTAAHGYIVLVAASGGRVGMINHTSEKDAELNDVLWWSTAGGNPHAIERIENNGSIVTASSNGYLNLYSPTAVSKPSTLALVKTYSFAGAHGVLWDPSMKLLWAIGDKQIRWYKVTGTYRNTRLSLSGSKTISGLGHDLQPDYKNKGYLLFTASYGTYQINTSTKAITRLSTETRVKALVRHSSGELLSVRGDNAGSRDWGSPWLRFSDSADRERTGAEFYKARIWSHLYE